MFSKHWSPPTLKRAFTLNAIITHIHLLPFPSRDSPMLFPWHLSPSCLLVLSCCVTCSLTRKNPAIRGLCLVAFAVGVRGYLCSYMWWGPALIWPRASLITHLQAAPSDPLLSLDFSHTIAFYSDSSEMGLHCLESPSKSRIRQYSQNQAVWLSSIYSGYCSKGFFPVQSHSVPFLIESLDQFTVSPKVYSSW